MNKEEETIVSEVEKKERNTKSKESCNKNLNYKVKLTMSTQYFLIRYETENEWLSYFLYYKI